MTRTFAKTITALGLLLLTMTAVAFAQDPTPTPSPTPTPEVTVTPTAIATFTATPEPTPSPTETPTELPTETATATPTAAETATPSPSPEAPVVLATAAQPTPTPTEAAETPTPVPTSTPPEQMTGAALTGCRYISDGVYEPITISADQPNSVYNDARNIFPAPPDGCDTITDPDAARRLRVTVCHLQADGTYLLLTLPPGDLGGHENHKGDIIPAPHRQCPGETTYVVPTVTATATPTPRPVRTPAPTPTSSPAGNGVLGQLINGALRPAPAPAAAPVQGRLPFTGFDLWLVACLGLGMTLMGAGLRLLAAQPPVGVTR